MTVITKGKPRPPDHHEADEDFRRRETFKKISYLDVRHALRNERNDYPFFLYKYLSVETSIDHIKCLLIDSDFYLSSCEDFNDPFDTTARIILDSDVKQRRKRFTEIVRTQDPKLNRKQQEAAVTKMMLTYTTEPQKIREIFEKNTRQAGIFCLTENPKNILMWSHYASDHKGLVLQFNMAKDPESMLYALKMHYSKSYPSFDISTTFDKQFESIVLRKACDWSYEEEWRILRIRGARTFQSFKPDALTGLIFGCKASTEFKNKILEILKERSIAKLPALRVYEAKKHASKYELNVFKLT